MSGVIVCGVGTTQPVRIVGVTLRHAHGLDVTEFATTPLPLPHDQILVEGSGPLSRLGLSAAGPHLVRPCQPGWESDYSSSEGGATELAFSYGLMTAAPGRADGLDVAYRIGRSMRTLVIAVSYPITLG